MSKITTIVNNIISKVNEHTTDVLALETLNSNHINLSGVTAYHLLQGNLAVSNSTTTQGFNTTLYTGNGSTQSITTGIDMSTQWGNTAEEKFGGLVWVKGRSTVSVHRLYDTIRGAGYSIQSDQTNPQALSTEVFSSLNNNGFSLGSNPALNTSAATYASWNFQTTHRISGTTNHGKAYTCHYNPFTGFTIVKYEGSGLAGHEITHHLGRKLGFYTIKNLTTANHWLSNYEFGDGNLVLNLTNSYNSTHIATNGINILSIDYISGTDVNASSNSYIMYGWANSYFDKASKLIGNYEIGVYQGTGASGNKVKTRGKPAWIMIKRLDNIGHWAIYNNQSTINNFLCANLVSAEESLQPLGTFNENGFTINNTVWSDVNALNGQYLYMVAYDTNSNGGGSFYEKTTDNAQLQAVNTIIPTAQGIDSNGAKNMIVSKNETITGISLTEGVNYVYWEND